MYLVICKDWPRGARKTRAKCVARDNVVLEIGGEPGAAARIILAPSPEGQLKKSYSASGSSVTSTAKELRVRICGRRRMDACL